MEITKRLTIGEVRATQVTNVPFKILLGPGKYPSVDEDKGSSLTLDEETCKRYGIPYSLDVLGQPLIIKIRSRGKPRARHKKRRGVVVAVEQHFESNVLRVYSLEKKESRNLGFGTVRTSRSMTLESFYEGGLFSSLPCPLYRLVLELTEKEYEKCATLPADTFFTVNFKLGPRVEEKEVAREPVRVTTRTIEKASRRLVRKFKEQASDL